jgi:hypothetical protein
VLVLPIETEETQRSEGNYRAMRKIWFRLIFAGVACLCAAQADKGNSPATSASAQATKEGSGNLICSISVQKTEWQQPQSVEVGVVIENRADAELSVPVVPSFILKPHAATEEPQKSELSYLALWDLEKGTTLPLSATVSLQLKPGGLKKVSSDITSLLWSRINWSVLPHSKLFKVVPAGGYSLRLELTGKDGKILCSSNAVGVVIK